MGGLAEFVALSEGFRRVAVDTSGCIYFLQRSSTRKALVRNVFERAASGDLVVELPTIVKLELLVQPMRIRSWRAMVRVRRFTERQLGVRVTAISEAGIYAAAELRAVSGLKAPDALVAASATVAGCDAIIGNDRAFGALNGLGSTLRISSTRLKLPLPRYVHIDDYVDIQQGDMDNKGQS